MRCRVDGLSEGRWVARFSHILHTHTLSDVSLIILLRSISIYFDVAPLFSQNYPQCLVKLSVRYLYSVLVRSFVRSFFDLFGVRGVNVCGFRPFVFRVLSLLRSHDFFFFDSNFNTTPNIPYNL